MPSHHELKSWPSVFQAVLDGRKLFEVRRNDRDFQVGHVLHLREWDPGQPEGNHPLPDLGDYTGRELKARVTYVLHGGQFGIEPGYCVMQLEVLDGL